MENFILKHSKVLKFSLWKMNLKLLGILLFGVILVGCTNTRRLGEFTAISSYNVQNLKYDTKNKKSVEGEVCDITLGYPLGVDRLKRAVADAIQAGRASGSDGDLLVNVRIENIVTNRFLYQNYCIKVTGDLVKISEP